MKEATGKDPSFTEFYFHTHQKKKDKSWVNKKVETAYNNFTQKKKELLASQSALVDKGDTNSARQPSQLSEMDIFVMSVSRKKKERVTSLDSLDRSVRIATQSTSAKPKEVYEMIRSQVHESNAELYNQLQEK